MKVVVRVDASADIGSGHVMRGLALGQALRAVGWGVVFATCAMPPLLEGRLRDESFGIAHLDARPGSGDDATRTRAVASRERAAWVVLDGYLFDGRYQERLAAQSAGVLLVDDEGGADRYRADIILNQNLHALESLYASRAPGTLLLLGPRYALLRREFARRPPPRRDPEVAGRRVLVTLGGADPNNVTSTLVAGLEALGEPRLEVVVTVGASNRHGKALERAIRGVSFSVRLEHDAKDMRGLMEWADVAVAAAGTTSWELAFMGVPALLLVLSDNQQATAARLDAAGAALNLGWALDASADAIATAVSEVLQSPEGMQRMSECGQSIVDGKGASRVVEAMAGANPGREPISLDHPHEGDI